MFSIEKGIKEGWKLSGDQEGLVLMRDSVKLVFDMTENGAIICEYLQREHKIGAVLASTGEAISIEKAHTMTGHHDEANSKIVLEWGWFLKKGPMLPCEACSVSKAKQLAINKNMDNSKKATRAGKRIFSDLATIKVPQGSGTTTTNKNWHIVVDQYTGYKESVLDIAKT